MKATPQVGGRYGVTETDMMRAVIIPFTAQELKSNNKVGKKVLMTIQALEEDKK